MPSTTAQVIAATFSERTTEDLRQIWREHGGTDPVSTTARYYCQQIAAELAKRGEVPNPVIKTTALTFDDALYFARHGEPRI